MQQPTIEYHNPKIRKKYRKKSKFEKYRQIIVNNCTVNSSTITGPLIYSNSIFKKICTNTLEWLDICWYRSI